MSKRFASILLSLLIANAALAADKQPFAQLPTGASIAVASMVGDDATALLGKVMARAENVTHAVAWKFDARLTAVAQAELERAGRFRVVPLTLDPTKLAGLPDIAQRSPRSHKLRNEAREQLEALGPPTGAAAYLVIGRTSLPNDLDKGAFDISGYGLYKYRGMMGPPTPTAYARLRLHLIDAKDMRNLANRTIVVSKPVDTYVYKMPWEQLKPDQVEALGAMLGTALESALVAELRELGIEAATAP